MKRYTDYKTIKIDSVVRLALPEFVPGGPSSVQMMINNGSMCTECPKYIPLELRAEIRASTDYTKLWESCYAISGRECRQILSKRDVLNIKDKNLGCGRCEIVPEVVQQNLDRKGKFFLHSGIIYSIDRKLSKVTFYNAYIDLLPEISDVLYHDDVSDYLQGLAEMVGKEIMPEVLVPEYERDVEGPWSVPGNRDLKLCFSEAQKQKPKKSLVLNMVEEMPNGSPKVLASLVKLRYTGIR